MIKKRKYIPATLMLAMLILETFKKYFFLLFVLCFLVFIFINRDIILGILYSCIFTILIIEPIKLSKQEKIIQKQTRAVLSDLNQMHSHFKYTIVNYFKLMNQYKIQNVNQLISQLKEFQNIIEKLSKTTTEENRNVMNNFIDYSKGTPAPKIILTTIEHAISIIERLPSDAAIKSIFFPLINLSNAVQCAMNTHKNSSDPISIIRTLILSSEGLLTIVEIIEKSNYLKTSMNYSIYESYNESMWFKTIEILDKDFSEASP